jgi:Cu+-exporting ATPase
MATAIDPICKMEVNTGHPPGGSSEHRGDTYYFCAPGCKAAFDRDPEKHLTQEAGEAPQERRSLLGRLFGRR